MNDQKTIEVELPLGEKRAGGIAQCMNQFKAAYRVIYTAASAAKAPSVKVNGPGVTDEEKERIKKVFRGCLTDATE